MYSWWKYSYIISLPMIKISCQFRQYLIFPTLVYSIFRVWGDIIMLFQDWYLSGCFDALECNVLGLTYLKIYHTYFSISSDFQPNHLLDGWQANKLWLKTLLSPLALTSILSDVVSFDHIRSLSIARCNCFCIRSTQKTTSSVPRAFFTLHAAALGPKWTRNSLCRPISLIEW